MEAISTYRPSSKSSLKMFCMMLAKGDVKQASELYDYMIKDMEDLPVFDPVEPTAMQNAKNTLTGVLGFFRENKDELAQGYEFLRGILATRGKNLPSLGGGATEVVSKALPPIN